MKSGRESGAGRGGHVRLYQGVWILFCVGKLLVEFLGELKLFTGFMILEEVLLLFNRARMTVTGRRKNRVVRRLLRVEKIMA